jgi:enterochelin esterase family protein
MLKTIVALGAALAGLAIGSASAAGIVQYGLEAPSPTLGHAIPYAVYTPFPSPADGERWPVVYLYHGTSGKDGDWFTWGNLGPILDGAIADGRIPPMIVVAPGAGDSWYVDDPDPGSYASSIRPSPPI